MDPDIQNVRLGRAAAAAALPRRAGEGHAAAAELPGLPLAGPGLAEGLATAPGGAGGMARGFSADLFMDTVRSTSLAKMIFLLCHG